MNTTTVLENTHLKSRLREDTKRNDDFFKRCQFCNKREPLKRVGVQRACQRCHRTVLAYFDAIVQAQVRDDFAEQGGEDGDLS